MTIPSGTTAIVLDGDVDTVAALDAIAIESGGTLAFRNTGKEISLTKTVLSGAGAVTGIASASVRFETDNPDFTGTMNFVQTKVTVTARHGLGSGTVTHDSGNNAARLWFYGAGLTNDANIVAKGTRNSSSCYFVCSLSDQLVFNGTFKAEGGGSHYYGNTTFNGAVDETAHSGAISIRDGCTAVYNAAVSLAGSKNFWVGDTASKNARAFLNATGNAWDDSVRFCGNGTFILGVANALDPDHCLNTLAANTHVTKFDLNGCDQTTTYVKNDPSMSDASTGYANFLSETAATLTMSANGSCPAYVKFSDRASLRHTGSGTYTIRKQFSDTTGTLYVDQGCVAFAGTGAGSVTVKANFVKGETFDWTGAAGNGDVTDPANRSGNRAPTLDGSSVLRFSGAAGTAATLTGGGALYGIEFRNGHDFTLSSDSLLALGPGGILTDPNGADVDVVYTLDASVAVAFPQDAAWTIADGTTLALPKDFSSPADDDGIRVSGGAVSLSGDNSSLLAPLSFSNTALRVSAPHALGAASRATSIYYGGLPRAKFVGNGLTNCVPIVWDASSASSDSCLTESLDDPFCQKGHFTFALDSDKVRQLTQYFYVGRNFRFEGGMHVSRLANVQFCGSGADLTHLTIAEGAMDLKGTYRWCSFNDLTLHLDATNTTYYQLYYNGTIVCGATNAITPVAGTGQFGLGVAQQWWGGTVDLNGHDQKIGTVFYGGTTVSQGDPRYGTIRSETEAFLIGTRSDGTAGAEQTPLTAKFTGLAGFRQTGKRCQHRSERPVREPSLGDHGRGRPQGRQKRLRPVFEVGERGAARAGRRVHWDNGRLARCPSASLLPRGRISPKCAVVPVQRTGTSVVPVGADPWAARNGRGRPLSR